MKRDCRRTALRAVFCLLAALAMLAMAAFARGEAAVPPRPSRYVTDGAGVLSSDRASALNEKLAAFERETSDQVLVFTATAIPEGTTLEEFANRAFHEWGIGQKGKSNGLVLFVFPQERKMRIEVGYGLEGAIPDALAHRITDETIKPHFRSGDYAAGIEAGVDAIFAAARGEGWKGSGRTVAEGARAQAAPGSALPVLILLVVVFGFFGLFLFLIIKAARGGFAGAARSLGGASSSGWSSSSTSSSSWSSSSDSSSSDSSSSSSFDSGGGDSGGGGASDSW